MSSVERFYVREHEGYPINVKGGLVTPGNGNPGVEYMVIDRDYCHRVVRSFPPNDRRGNNVSYAHTRRRLAFALCLELNEAS